MHENIEHCLFSRISFFVLYIINNNIFKKYSFFLRIWIPFFLLHHICLSVCFSPLPPSLLCASDDPCCGFFCQEDTKYQGLPTGAVMAKYTPVWEQNPIYPVSCTRARIPYVRVHVRSCAMQVHALLNKHACVHLTGDRLFSHLCARAYFLPLTISPLSVGEIFMRKGEQPSPLLFFWSPDVR